MKPENVLALWERVHGHLNERWRREFLTDPRVALLCSCELASLEPAVKAHSRLDDIVSAVQANPAPVVDRIPLSERTRKGRQSGSIWDPPAAPGTTDPRYR